MRFDVAQCGFEAGGQRKGGEREARKHRRDFDVQPKKGNQICSVASGNWEG